MSNNSVPIKFISDAFQLNARLCKPSKPEAAALFVHGICGDLDEIGIFTNLERKLSGLGVMTLRFDFRGHGDSDGEPSDASVQAEIKDLIQAMNFLKSEENVSSIGVIAASFGASIVLLSDISPTSIKTAVFLNPVIDFERTFLDPITPWGKENFGREKIESSDSILLEDCELGKMFIEDLTRYEPKERLTKWNIPTYIIHGDKDDAVPYLSSKEMAESCANTYLATMPGTGHGFDDDFKRQIVVDLTVLWIKSRLLEID